jgi:carboxyl-terminal processing protease
MGSLFDCYWTRARERIHDTERAARSFTDSTHSALRARAERAQDLDELAEILNPFFESLRVSHLHLATSSDLMFYLYAGFHSPWRLDTVEVRHIGIQGTPGPGGFVIRNVFEGYPAERAGLRRGDVLTTCNGRAFRPFGWWAEGKSSVVTVRRNGRPLTISIDPVEESIHRSFLQAMRNSVSETTIEGRRIGYIHLWTVLYPLVKQEFDRLVRDSLSDCDGIVLDLRDGFGGDWYDALDPFFEDRSEYAQVTVEDRLGTRSTHSANSIAPHPCYERPMVAIINEGTRSGKEGVAFQLKKSRRARLVGATTAGAFRGGEIYYCPGESQAVLVVAINELWLDGVEIENVGVAPDVPLEFPVDRSIGGDPQRRRAFEEMRRMLSGTAR